MQLSNISFVLPKSRLWSLFRPQVYQPAAFAFITTQEKGEKRYLLQWNEKWHCFNFIGGKLDNQKGDKNDLVCTIRREIAEEIGISNLDSVIAVKERKVVHMRQFSLRERRLKNYRFSIFEINFFPYLSVDQQKVTHSLIWLTSQQTNVYVTAQEVLNLRTQDGKPISKTVRRILKTMGELPGKS